MEKNIAVIYKAEEDERAVFEEILASVARIDYTEGASEQERKDVLHRADVVLCKSFSSGEIAPGEIPLLGRANLIQLIFAGADNVPFHLIPEGMIVASNAGAFAEPLAEHVLAMALCLAKRFRERYELLCKGVFDRSGHSTFLKGRTCGIVGFGGNGKAVAGLMRAVGMRVYGISRRGEPDETVDFVGTVDDLQKVLQVSDLVVLTVPLTKATRGLIGERELGWMKDDAILINVARGAVIDQKALYHHLEAHPSFRAGIDTWWSEPAHHGEFTLEYPFFQLPNFIGTPHIADEVIGMRARAARSAADNVRRFLTGREIRGVLSRTDYTD